MLLFWLIQQPRVAVEKLYHTRLLHSRSASQRKNPSTEPWNDVKTLYGLEDIAAPCSWLSSSLFFFTQCWRIEACSE